MQGAEVPAAVGPGRNVLARPHPHLPRLVQVRHDGDPLVADEGTAENRVVRKRVLMWLAEDCGVPQVYPARRVRFRHLTRVYHPEVGDALLLQEFFHDSPDMRVVTSS